MSTHRTHRDSLAFAKSALLNHYQNTPYRHRAYQSVISSSQYSCAIKEIEGWKEYRPTPLIELTALARAVGVSRLFYKDEGKRFETGSFKSIGAAYSAAVNLATELSRRFGRPVSLKEVTSRKHLDEIREITVACATDGNHGRALAWSARKFGCQCIVYVHKGVSQSRCDAISGYGARLVRTDFDYDRTVQLAMNEARGNNWLLISDTSWDGYTEVPRHIMAGYGVIVDELLNQLPSSVTHVFLQGGVGAFAASHAARLRQCLRDKSPLIVIVEPAYAACLYASARAGCLKSVPILQETIMAGLSCGVPSQLAWQILCEEATHFLTISDEPIAETMRLLANPLPGDKRIVAGESAVAGLVGLIGASLHPSTWGTIGLNSSSRVVVVGTEGATDPELYEQLVNRC